MIANWKSDPAIKQLGRGVRDGILGVRIRPFGAARDEIDEFVRERVEGLDPPVALHGEPLPLGPIELGMPVRRLAAGLLGPQSRLNRQGASDKSRDCQTNQRRRTPHFARRTSYRGTMQHLYAEFIQGK